MFTALCVSNAVRWRRIASDSDDVSRSVDVAVWGDSDVLNIDSLFSIGVSPTSGVISGSTAGVVVVSVGLDVALVVAVNDADAAMFCVAALIVGIRVAALLARDVRVAVLVDEPDVRETTFAPYASMPITATNATIVVCRPARRMKSNMSKKLLCGFILFCLYFMVSHAVS